jgi:SAM-dependent methyltransferase
MFVENARERMGLCHRSESVAEIIEGQRKHFAEFGERNKRLIREVQLRGFIDANSSILDFGAGFGGISLAIKEALPQSRLFAVEGCDIQRTLLRSQGINVVEEVENIPQNAFDFVAMVEVLEHLEDPCSVLTALACRLTANGSILIATPVGRLRNGELGSGFETESHLQFFSELSLGDCLLKSGFRKPRFEYLASLYPNPDVVDSWISLLPTKGRIHLVTFAELQ